MRFPSQMTNSADDPDGGAVLWPFPPGLTPIQYLAGARSTTARKFMADFYPDDFQAEPETTP